MSITEGKPKVHYGKFSFHNTYQLHIAHTHTQIISGISNNSVPPLSTLQCSCNGGD